MSRRERAGVLGLMVISLIISAPTAAQRSAQPVEIAKMGDALQIKAPTFGFIEGRVRDTLRDGRTVRVELDLAIVAQPGGPAIGSSQQSVTLSFDLWEERYAVTLAGKPARSVSHLTASAAETWCLESLRVPMSQLSRLGRGGPFWIRLSYTIAAPAPAPAADDATGFSIARMVDLLSRRRDDGNHGRSLEAGPFRLPE
jgi:hypothetical protein